MQPIQIHSRLCREGFSTEYFARPAQQLILPVGDLIGVYVMLLRQFSQRLVASNSEPMPPWL